MALVALLGMNRMLIVSTSLSVSTLRISSGVVYSESSSRER